ncbi:transcription factor TFIIIB subunit brf1 [Elasticomyces elasticus]|nr:transcription factor TFIIIB subunit brf1 [Elasticomyces elasticus]KAK4964994.1 transcription factor TFIIIB subunit brf1 [Elasticomyces elasticus]
MSAPKAPPRRQRLDTLNPPPPGRPRPKPRAAPTRPACCEEPKIESEDGSRVCVNCGTQIEEANIVADVTFEENAQGAATVQGGFIGENARHARTLGTGAYRKIGGGQRDATQSIERTGRQALNALCPSLGVAEATQNIAQNLFNMAAQQEGGATNFTTGRRTDEVVGACLFAACRRAKDNAIMLMDIAEVQKINVFRLGEVYKDLCRNLYLTNNQVGTGLQHTIDIEPLIQKYCRKLEFGPKTRDVATDAVRILKRMKRDWIVTGRHPAGLCGACIILAARMNNFRRTVREVVYVAKVADQTIALRVEEFRRTRASNLTIDQFRQHGVNLKGSHDPPALSNSAREKARFEEKKRQRMEAGIARRTAERETMERESADREPIVISDGEEESDDDDSSRDGSAAPDGEEPRRKKRRTEGPATQQPPRFDADGFAIPALPVPNTQDEEPAETDENATPKRKRGPGRPKGTKNKKHKLQPIEITEEELEVEQELADEIDENLHNELLEKMRDEAWQAKQDELAAEALERVQPELAQGREETLLAERRRREELGVDWRPDPEINTEDPSPEELEAEFENDPEVSNCLLNEEEAKVKEAIWIHHNEDWLRAQHEKELLRKMAEHLNPGGEAAKKSKRGAKGGKKRSKLGDGSVLENAETPIETPADAASAMLKKRAPAAFSKFVDYEALQKIYNPAGSPSPSQSEDGSRSRAVSVVRSVAGGMQTPEPTQRVTERGVAGSTTPGPREVSVVPGSPVPSQVQSPAGGDEEMEDDDEGSAGRGGWDDADDDWGGGEEDDDDADFNKAVGGSLGGALGGDGGEEGDEY